MHLTRRQKEILDYLGGFIGEHGCAPPSRKSATTSA